MTAAEERILEIILRIETQKALQRRAPVAALMREVLKEASDVPPEGVRAALRSLTRSGKIVFGRTVNDFYFMIKT